MENFYISPICTTRLGDALVSISNMYHRLSVVKGPISVYYHHWPEYYDALWALVEHPRRDIDFIKLPNASNIPINSSTEKDFKHILLKRINRSQYRWHPSRAYSIEICNIHPTIRSTLEKLGIAKENILLNATDLDDGADYVRMTIPKTPSSYVTFHSRSLNPNGVTTLLIEEVESQARETGQRPIDVGGIRNVKELVETLAGSSHHFGVDSGPAHIALALGVPVTMYFKELSGHKGLAGIFGVYGQHVSRFRLIDCRDIND